MRAPFSAREALDWTGGRLLSGDADATLAGASIDSRTVERGELFVAIVGPNHDGHQFIGGAVARGAAGLLVESGRSRGDTPATPIPVIGVEDTTLGIGALAAGHRSGFGGEVVAITGSNGKTTTKEMCAAILSVVGPCHRTPGNLNNQWGLPLTLLSRGERDRSLVVELGMNHRGEIAQLTDIARPTVGVITNVGTAHIEYLGSREEIAREKGDLVANLPENATAVLNADDPLVAAQAERTRARVIRFGSHEDADVREESSSRLDDRGYAIKLMTPAGGVSVEVAGLGPTTVANALAAAAAAFAAGASLTDIATGLADYRPIKSRLERRELSGGIALIDDTYNANPQSTEAALRLLAELKGEHRGVAVLGDMGELGDTTEAAHQQAGRLTATLGIDVLIALGDRAETVADGALEAGMSRDRVLIATDHADAGARACAALRTGDTVLIKGSRSMQMERVVEAIASEKGY